MPESSHPYKSQPARAFWGPTVAKNHLLEIPDWYQKKWPITGLSIATAGSCFAQHIGRYLRQSGFNFLDVEPAPKILKKDRWQEHGYGIYSARFGNVYTSRQLLQLLQRALGLFLPQESAWEKDGGHVDPFRPTIEARPFASVAELEANRTDHLAAVAQLFAKTDVFVFTLGLTETWLSKADGAAFPVCPGTAGGRFDSEAYQFSNMGFGPICKDLEAFMDLARTLNPRMRFLYTVSPVPLVATATPQQVVVASSYSKSVLRAVAGHLAQKHSHVDYFPSYEIISSHVMRGVFYAADMRSVVEPGVEHVMRQFFAQHVPTKAAGGNGPVDAETDDPDDVACDELLLAPFGEQP